MPYIIITGVGVYNETTNATGIGIGGGSETVTHGMAQVIHENTVAIALGLGSSSDTITFPSNKFNETTNATGIGFGNLLNIGNGIGTVYETTNATAIGSIRSNERIVAVEYGIVFGSGIAGSSDTYIPSGTHNTWYEFNGAIGLGSIAGINAQKTAQTANASGIGRAVNSATVKFYDASTPTAKGKASSFDTRFYHDTTNATTLGSASSVEKTKYKDTPTAAGLGSGGGSSAQISAYKSTAIGIGRCGGSLSAFASSDYSISTSKGIAGGLGFIVYGGIHNATAIGLASSPIVPAVKGQKITEKTNAIALGNAGGTQVRAIIEVTNATAKGIASHTFAMVVHESNSAKAIGIAGSATLANDSSGIIPAIRYHIKNTLSGPLEIVEGLPEQEVLQTINLPFAVILASKPTRLEMAVQDQAFSISFDVIYAVKTQAGIDNAPALRSAIRSVEQALILDYTLTGNRGIKSCFNLDIDATPFDKVNEYAKMLQKDGQGVEVAITSFTVSYTEFNQAQ